MAFYVGQTNFRNPLYVTVCILYIIYVYIKRINIIYFLQISDALNNKYVRAAVDVSKIEIVNSRCI